MNAAQKKYSSLSRRRRMRMGTSEMTMATLTKKELQYCAWFVYVADELLSESKEDIDAEFPFFLELCKYAGYGNKLRKLLDAKLGEMQIDKRMYIEASDNPKEIKANRFPITKEPFKYEMDEWINRQIPEDLLSSGDAERISLFVDLHRIMIMTEDDHILQRIIYSLFFGNGTTDDMILISSDTNKKRIRNIASEYSRLNFVCESMKLSVIEGRYLNLLFFIDQLSSFRRFSVQLDELQSQVFQRFLNISSREFNALNRRSGNLRTLGFVLDDGYLDYDFREAVLNQSLDCYYNDTIKPCDVTDAYELSSFQVSEEKTDILNCFLSGDAPCNILFYGAPGAGKTEFAKALVKANGLKSYVFLNEAELSTSKGLSKLLTYLSMRDLDKVVIIDEADKMLSTVDNTGFFGIPSPNAIKGIVNKLLEQSNSKAIWITNYTRNIDISTKRRFSISHYFDPMSEVQLRQIAENKLKVLKYDDELQNKVLDLFGKYKVTGASVDYVVKALESIGTEKAVHYAESILKENSELLYGRQKMREIIDENTYDTSIVNSSIPVGEILEMVENARKYAISHPHAKQGVRMLFYGLSGTGKTELARYISQQLGKPILLKRASDILDKYVGESEKNISEAFAEAERTGAILLFDEADSFFADRNAAEHSWERTQVNEFLTQMEEFSGILICTTNLKHIMDGAMYRRFNIKAEFKALTEYGIFTLLGKFFPEYQFTKDQINQIAEYDSVTPGDFSSLGSRIRFVAEEKVNADFITKELITLQEEKEGNSRSKRCIGFSA